ncbi:unnamed protein product [Plutella xylostella]|uniref:(diamondback moth) hypothetical protein n=1 Tax=Plutella xylostella TaxID=51655 RepID=A0A8S4FG15_PLUXY|nr:unnamed protein product [Plutella xylostella]
MFKIEAIRRGIRAAGRTPRLAASVASRRVVPALKDEEEPGETGEAAAARLRLVFESARRCRCDQGERAAAAARPLLLAARGCPGRAVRPRVPSGPPARARAGSRGAAGPSPAARSPRLTLYLYLPAASNKPEFTYHVKCPVVAFSTTQEVSEFLRHIAQKVIVQCASRCGPASPPPPRRRVAACRPPPVAFLHSNEAL